MASLAVGVLPSLRRGDGTWRTRSGEQRGGAEGGEGGDDDVEMQRSHGREASGRSVLSSMSERLASLRANDSASTRNAAARDVEAQMQRADRNAAAAEAANTPATAAGAAQPPATFRSAAYLGGLRGLAGAAAARKGPSRREREEAATLFGPNLANYFGSGSSSSGAVLGSTPAPSAAATAAAEATAATTAADATIASRRARLGSRGRARGASLSGVASQLSLHQADDSMSSLPLDASSPVISHPLDGAAAGALPQGDVVAMAEGIELDTLKRWIQRSVDGGATEVPQKGSAQDSQQGGASSSGAPPAICSTLQSYVNLKRNTVKLSVEQGVAAPSVIAAQPPAIAQDETAAQATTLHNAPSLGNMSIAQGSTGGNAGLGSMPSFVGPKPTSTHILHFEYDCAAPSASLQLFLRASRKHGSWLNASVVDGSSDESSAGAAATQQQKYMAQRGPPPHVLGWPVHSAKLQRGFGAPLRTALALKLEYYAPPAGLKKARKRTAAAGEEEEEDDEEELLDLPAETPGLNVQRQLGETPGLNESRQLGDRPVPNGATALEAEQTQTSTEPETKEAKAAREKSERETLKLAVVVEALDEDGKPLREPNLQTTYLRLTSLPARASPNAPVDPELAQAAIEGTAAPDVTASTEAGAPLRMWSVQVEGQEAEIGPHRFQLQELYGLSTRPPAVRAAPVEVEGEETTGAALPLLDLEGSNGTECLICLSAPPTTLLLPCTHSLCLECAVQLRESVKAMRETERRRGRTPRRKYCCPACRRAFTSMLHLSAADEKQMAQATM